MQGIFKTVLATVHLRGRLTSTAASLQPDPASFYILVTTFISRAKCLNVKFTRLFYYYVASLCLTRRKCHILKCIRVHYTIIHWYILYCFAGLNNRLVRI